MLWGALINCICTAIIIIYQKTDNIIINMLLYNTFYRMEIPHSFKNKVLRIW